MPRKAIQDGESRWTRRRHLRRKLTVAIKHLDAAGALVWAVAQELKESGQGGHDALARIAEELVAIIEALDAERVELWGP